MNLFGRDLTREVAIVAEVGVNHEGNLETARKLVRAAAGAGADAVKFQSYTPERFISTSDAERFARVSRFALDADAHRTLARDAAEAGIAFMSTPVTEDWVPLLAELGCAIKIASGDLTFEPVIRAAARSGKPVIVSTGCGTVEEVDRAVGWVQEEVGSAALPDRLILLHCVSAYPAPAHEINLSSIPFLRRRYGVEVGYSNHAIELEPVIGAAAVGASVIEVHVTDQREGRTFRDHQMSFEPAQLQALRRSVDTVRAALGEPGKTVQPSEAGSVWAIRKGIVAARNLTKGNVLSDTDLMYARPATEFPSFRHSDLVGRRLTRGLMKGETIRRTDVEGLG